jgi:8-amino-7-oxononanoate synthase
MNESLAARLRASLDRLDQLGLRRRLRPPAGLDLASNDYLGLARHPRVREAMVRAVETHGVGSTGSRLLRGERDAFAAIERRFAAFKGEARSLYFPTGYQANLALLTTLAEPGDIFLSDERNHASLIDGMRLSRAARRIFPHNDVEAVERLLVETAGKGERFVVVESLFSMDGDLAPLADYTRICRAHGAHVIVDEAHAVGVFGPAGRGLVALAGVSDDVLVTIDTAGKALGVAGAFVSGSDLVIESLVQRARPFIFSTAPPPAVAAALDAALDLVADEPWRREVVLERAEYLRRRLAEAGMASPGASQIVPVVLGDNRRAAAVADQLQGEGFDVRAVRPPTVPEGTARLRLSVNVDLTPDAIDGFVEALAAAVREAPVSA